MPITTPIDFSNLYWRTNYSDLYWQDGSTILAAIEVYDQDHEYYYYEYQVVEVAVYDEGVDLLCEGEVWGWDIDDVDKFILIEGSVG